MLTEENYRISINSYSNNDWKPLIEFIAKLNNANLTSKLVTDGTDKNGVPAFPYYEHNELVSEFIKIVYNIPIMIAFDWGSWDEGRKIVENNNFDFDTIDIPTKCKLISAIVRSDRFCEGDLVIAFESGQIPKMLKSIEKQLGYTNRAAN